jgi:hypothetical protein
MRSQLSHHDPWTSKRHLLRHGILSANRGPASFHAGPMYGSVCGRSVIIVAITTVVTHDMPERRASTGYIPLPECGPFRVDHRLVRRPETAFGEVCQRLAVCETLPSGIRTCRSSRRKGRSNCGCATGPVQEVPSGSSDSRPWSCFRRRRVIRAGATIENARVGSSRRGIAGSRMSSRREFLNVSRRPAPPSPGGMRTGIPLCHGRRRVSRFAADLECNSLPCSVC